MLTTGSKGGQAEQPTATMPRPKFRREPCECLDCLYPSATAVPASSNHASAVMDPPPKCIIIIGEGFLQQATQGSVPSTNDSTGTAAGHLELAATGSPSQGAETSLDAAMCPHLDGVAMDGCSGLVALRENFPGDTTLNINPSTFILWVLCEGTPPLQWIVCKVDPPRPTLGKRASILSLPG